ncbi:hypothetical protein [Brachybacterium sp. EE-P12]|uniref:hypothetical protein n=1 Tax=Brachybacterium sp. EE-P12 TaxID=2306299 RepID=UPI000F07FC4A|nr:hypothetical protein [Brachybacterium sp. EE-P12]
MPAATITPFRAPPRDLPGPPPRAPLPTEAELFPFLGVDDVCIYCGRFQTYEEAEQRTATHIRADLLAVHRTNEALMRDFGEQHPGYQDDVYDLLCEPDSAVPAPAVEAVAR